ncbi:gustatory receptor for sugar taste 64a-like [Achroia grisella]|uniref:gustatory receptor for sugar taste 64a-like n=1 Tax=Achroia grisella TaxID=688607 RepID=UPI0027D2F820|nr:gustatory receptor for sugar taste 64a-like [Achroia grisella]
MSARENDLFLHTLTHVFTIAKWFGIPTYGNKLTFLWAIILLGMLVAIEVAAIWKVIISLAGLVDNKDERGVTARLSGAIFYCNGLLSLILSWKLISSWKWMSKRWEKMETTSTLRIECDPKIRRRVIFVTNLVGLCACIEHMLSMMSATGFQIPPESYFKKYILSSHGFLLDQDDYTLWIAIPVFILSKSATILWNFQDLIIILLSMGLTSRYHRLNLYVKNLVQRSRKENKFISEINSQMQEWRRLREEYVQQAALVRMVDKELGPLMLLSNVNNFYFICLQLFLGINKGEKGLINRTYYFLSLGWLLFRACSVVLAAADVHLHSRKALRYLHDLSKSGHSIEIRRLKNQLTHDFVALTGMGLFSLDRQKLLEVTANIIKYELVLIQFDK